MPNRSGCDLNLDNIWIYTELRQFENWLKHLPRQIKSLHFKSNLSTHAPEQCCLDVLKLQELKCLVLTLSVVGMK